MMTLESIVVNPERKLQAATVVKSTKRRKKKGALLVLDLINRCCFFL